MTYKLSHETTFEGNTAWMVDGEDLDGLHVLMVNQSQNLGRLIPRTELADFAATDEGSTLYHNASVSGLTGLALKAWAKPMRDFISYFPSQDRLESRLNADQIIKYLGHPASRRGWKHKKEPTMGNTRNEIRKDDLLKVKESGKYGTFITHDGDDNLLLKMQEGGSYEAYSEDALELVIPHTVGIARYGDRDEYADHYRCKKGALKTGDILLAKNGGMYRVTATDTQKRRAHKIGADQFRKITTKAVAAGG